MKKIDITFIIAMLILALSGFLVTNLFYIPIIILVIYLAYYFLYMRKRIFRYLDRVEAIHACYNFINSFVISMSVKDSYDEAYLNGLRFAPKSMLEETNEIENMTIIERIKFLRQYFNLGIYKMFLNIVDLYQEQGGNILTLSEGLTRECTRVEKDVVETTSISNRHLAEFLVLWLLSFMIIIFLRFALESFYFEMLKQPLFVVLVTLFYLLFLGSAHLFFVKYSTILIKEDNLNE